MNYRKPDFYDSFSCLGGSCPITCCAGWQILIDEEKQQEYLAVPGSFGARLFACGLGRGGFSADGGEEMQFPEPEKSL